VHVDIVAPGTVEASERLKRLNRVEDLADVLPCSIRITPVTASKKAPNGQRPDPSAHYESVIIISRPLLVPKAITLVDDVVTRGSTFIGMIPRLEQAFPNVEISCFALVRTESDGELTEIWDSVEGRIAYDGRWLRRTP
jgi:predicted amidophosphoribosyltransferase